MSRPRPAAHRVRVAWAHLEARDIGYALDQFAPDFAHSFAGDHALVGLRASLAGEPYTNEVAQTIELR